MIVLNKMLEQNVDNKQKSCYEVKFRNLVFIVKCRNSSSHKTVKVSFLFLFFFISPYLNKFLSFLY